MDNCVTCKTRSPEVGVMQMSWTSGCPGHLGALGHRCALGGQCPDTEVPSPPGLLDPQDTLVALEALAQMWLQWGRGARSGLNLGLSWPGGIRGGPGGTQVTLEPGLEPLEQELRVRVMEERIWGQGREDMEHWEYGGTYGDMEDMGRRADMRNI